ncbi:hypothetical protein F5141DRAFT_1223118 [Pisolithus sp. B1]|nr:hypothetical protein F5141DRAFT_1223118 [Pisolithus sp. B1]
MSTLAYEKYLWRYLFSMGGNSHLCHMKDYLVQQQLLAPSIFLMSAGGFTPPPEAHLELSSPLQPSSSLSFDTLSASHPPVWTWTTKDGPNKGKFFQVPTTPHHL